MASEIRKIHDRLKQSSEDFEKRREENYKPLAKLILTVFRCKEQLKDDRLNFITPISKWEDSEKIYKLIFHGIVSFNYFEVHIYNKKKLFRKEELEEKLELAYVYSSSDNSKVSFKFYLEDVENFLEKHSAQIVKVLSDELISLSQKMGVKSNKLDSLYLTQTLSLSDETKFAMQAVDEVLKI